MARATLRQLKALIAVARHASFARAAAELHLSQPAVSMQIRDLESAAGMPLLERQGRTIRATAAGEQLLLYARRIWAALEEADDALARLRGLRAGRVVIGMVSTAEHFLPRLLARFRSLHPGIEIRLHLGNRDQLLRALNDNEVDLAVMGRPPQELAAHAEVFAPHPLGVIAPAAHALAGKRRLAPSVLEREAFIVREPGSGTRGAMEQFFGEQQIAPPVIMQMGSNETIKQAVMAGMGLAFLSLHTVAQELALKQLAVLDIQGLPIQRRWHIVNLQSRPLSPVAESFRQFMLAEGERLLASLLAPKAQRMKPSRRRTEAQMPAFPA